MQEGASSVSHGDKKKKIMKMDKSDILINQIFIVNLVFYLEMSKRIRHVLQLISLCLQSKTLVGCLYKLCE